MTNTNNPLDMEVKTLEDAQEAGRKIVEGFEQIREQMRERFPEGDVNRILCDVIVDAGVAFVKGSTDTAKAEYENLGNPVIVTIFAEVAQVASRAVTALPQIDKLEEQAMAMSAAAALAKAMGVQL